MLRSSVLLGAGVLSAVLCASAQAATPVTFQGQVAAGRFSLDLFSFDVAAGQTASLTGSVGSSAYDTVSMVPVVLGSIVIAVPLTIHYDALTFSDVRLGLQSDTTPTDGFNFANLAAGHYTFTLEGTSATGGVYAGMYTLSASTSPSPVPEPTTAALAVAALGVLGWRQRRAEPTRG